MRTRREGAVQDQTWVTSNPRELQGSRGTQSRLDRGATQRKSPSPASSSQWPALISAVCVVCPSARFSLSCVFSGFFSVRVPLILFQALVGGVWPPLDLPLPQGPSHSQYGGV